MITKEKIDQAENGSSLLKRDILPFLNQNIRHILSKVSMDQLKTVEEIRLRANKPIMVQNSHEDWFVAMNGQLTRRESNLFIASQDDIIKTLSLMSENSLYAYQDEIKNGFITLYGGHRVGIAGKVVLEGNHVKNIKEISGMNIRISREVLGCADKIISSILRSHNEVYNTLIISPPQCGKTTMLRDITRLISDGVDELEFRGLKVGVVDERSEIAACYRGLPQNRIGLRTDVLDGCPKSIGMVMMLRAMSPQVIVTDEIGNNGDRDAITQVINAGVKIITTAHGYSVSELKTRKEVLELIESRIFERYIVLSNSSGPGTIREVIDGATMNVING